MNDTEPKGNAARTLFVSNLTLDAFIGCYDYEQGKSQPVRIDLELDVAEPDNPMSDRLEDVVCYNRLTQNIKSIIAEGHIKLVETLAERIAAVAIDHPMVSAVRVRVGKPNAIPEAESAGVQIERSTMSSI